LGRSKLLDRRRIRTTRQADHVTEEQLYAEAGIAIYQILVAAG